MTATKIVMEKEKERAIEKEREREKKKEVFFFKHLFVKLVRHD